MSGCPLEREVTVEALRCLATLTILLCSAMERTNAEGATHAERGFATLRAHTVYLGWKTYTYASLVYDEHDAF